MNIQIGIHIDPPLALIPDILTDAGIQSFQTVLRNPVRLSKEGVPDQDDQEEYLRKIAGKSVFGIVHASLLTNLASTDPRIRNASAGALAADANLAQSLGMEGACFHIGYQKGHSDNAAALDAMARKLNEVITKLKPGSKTLLENGCEGSELGQTLEEISEAMDRLDRSSEHIGLVLDTCHLHAAGFDLSETSSSEKLSDVLNRLGLYDLLVAFHLNDSQYPSGSHRDRHACPGIGSIGKGLRSLVHHPSFSRIPMILEVESSCLPDAIQYLEIE
jgi:deoxyribonuclease-4